MRCSITDNQFGQGLNDNAVINVTRSNEASATNAPVAGPSRRPAKYRIPATSVSKVTCATHQNRMIPSEFIGVSPAEAAAIPNALRQSACCPRIIASAKVLANRRIIARLIRPAGCEKPVLANDTAYKET